MWRRRPLLMLLVLLIPLLFVTIVIASHRQSAIDPLDPPGFTPTPAPSDWLTPGNEFEAAMKIDAVHKRRVPVHRMALSKTQTQDFIQPTADGGCLAVFLDQVHENDTGSQPVFIPHVTRYKPDGKVSWDKRYDSVPLSGYGISMCIFPDDSFAVACRINAQDHTEMKPEDQLIRFRPDGSWDWVTEQGAIPAGGLERIFARADGSVLSAGTIDGSGLVGQIQIPRVAAFLIDRDGKVTTRYLQSGVGYQAMMDAVFDQETGLVLLSHEEQNADSPMGAIWQRKNKLTCLDDTLQERWSSVYDTNTVVHDFLTKTNDGGLLLSISLRPAQQPSASSQTMLVAIDPEGLKQWTFKEPTLLWYTGAASLADGRLIVSHQKTGTGHHPETTLMAYVNGQPDSAPIDSYQGTLMDLAATKDGGFTVIIRQPVGQLPQPPYISSIWMDTAVIVAHYDSAFRLTWRRTIDQYKHDQRIDLIVVTTHDRLLAG